MGGWEREWIRSLAASSAINVHPPDHLSRGFGALFFWRSRSCNSARKERPGRPISTAREPPKIRAARGSKRTTPRDHRISCPQAHQSRWFPFRRRCYLGRDSQPRVLTSGQSGVATEYPARTHTALDCPRSGTYHTAALCLRQREPNPGHGVAPTDRIIKPPHAPTQAPGNPSRARKQADNLARRQCEDVRLLARAAGCRAAGDRDWWACGQEIWWQCETSAC